MKAKKTQKTAAAPQTLVQKFRCKAHALADNARVHLSHEVVYVGYFVSVFAEGHGFYSLFGGVMAVFVILDIVGKAGEA